MVFLTDENQAKRTRAASLENIIFWTQTEAGTNLHLVMVYKDALFLNVQTILNFRKSRTIKQTKFPYL